MTVCPIECVRAACPTPDWLEKHETFTLTMVATVSAAITALLSYFLKSRCTKIKCFGMSCNRQPLNLDEIANANVNDIANVNANVNETI